MLYFRTHFSGRNHLVNRDILAITIKSPGQRIYLAL